MVSTFFGVVFILSPHNIYAFENKKTHPALTDKAAAASAIPTITATR